MGCRSVCRSGRGLAAGRLLLSTLLASVGLIATAPRAALAVGPNNDVQPANTLELTGLEQQFASVVDRVAPCVVAISASCEPIDSDDALRTEHLNPHKLDVILSKTTRTVGTGFFIDSDGYILTNEHVICEAEQLWVTTDDRKVYPAIVIGSDPRADLAVLKIPATGMRVATFAKPGPVHRGQWTIAIGNPYGMAAEGEMAMSVGVVSATERSLPKLSNKEGRLYSNLIQTTAEINPGNSGGPLFNLAGEVIGISTAVILPQKQTNGIGFAIPVTERFVTEIEQLKAGKEIVYSYLGVSVTDPTARERSTSGAKEGGARIDAIEPKGPADGSTLRTDDVVVKVNGEFVRDSDAFIRLIGHANVEQSATLQVLRDRKQVEVVVTPRRRPMPAVAVNRETQRFRWRGITLTAVPANWSGSKSGDTAIEGLYVVAIDDEEVARKLGVKQGQVIRSISGQSIKSIAELQKVIDSIPLDNVKFEVADSASVATAQDN